MDSYTQQRPTFHNSPAPVENRKPTGRSGGFKWISLQGATVVFLVLVAVVLLGLLYFLVFGHGAQDEGSFVNTGEYQAVFVNVDGSSGGQAYFGKITSISSSYITMTNVFYLQPGSSQNQFTLNNLSCALYNPEDSMVINRAQVDFWENLASKSQVTQDINKWYSDKLNCGSGSSTASAPASTTTPSSSTTGSAPTPGTKAPALP